MCCLTDSVEIALTLPTLAPEPACLHVNCPLEISEIFYLFGANMCLKDWAKMATSGVSHIALYKMYRGKMQLLAQQEAQLKRWSKTKLRASGGIFNKQPDSASCLAWLPVSQRSVRQRRRNVGWEQVFELMHNWVGLLAVLPSWRCCNHLPPECNRQGCSSVFLLHLGEQGRHLNRQQLSCTTAPRRSSESCLTLTAFPWAGNSTVLNMHNVAGMDL